MRIILYESSAEGGNFNYAVELFDAYKNDSRVTEVNFLVPSNAKKIKGALPILLHDRIAGAKIFQRFYFLCRTFINPLILFFYLLRQKRAFVILNDFEQLSAPIWSPFFKLFLTKHKFSVFLHDPDRDNYPPSKSWSKFSMNQIMQLMTYAFYHEHLPNKSYYRNKKTKFISVPHGPYWLPAAEPGLLKQLLDFKQSRFMIGILGNIRQEKNYELAIQSLQSDSMLCLLIAGRLSSSSVPIEKWKMLARELNVSDRILWEVDYMTESQFNAAIQVTDCVLLNYSSTFASQSGILNMLVPFKKRMIVSRTDSALTKMVERFNLGQIIQADSLASLNEGIRLIRSQKADDKGWQNYEENASWKNNVKIAIDAFEGH